MAPAPMNVSAPPITVPCFAKINLALDVLGLRPDRYHNVDTVLYEIDLADTLEASLAGGAPELTIEEGQAPEGEDNLASRAARALAGDGAVSLRLWKRIPMQAGLGGGSSDAASALRAAAHFSNTRRDLASVAAGLGSDVAFFLEGGCARARGRGEDLAPIKTQIALHILIVKPDAGASTAWAYSELDKRNQPRARRFAGPMTRALLANDYEAVLESLGNGFEPVVLARFPEIARLKERLVDAGAVATLLCGSGSAVFGVFPDREAAEGAAPAFPDVWHAAASGLPERSPL